MNDMQLDDWGDVRERIQACRDLQLQRAGKLNSRLDTTELDHYCVLGKPLANLPAPGHGKIKDVSPGAHTPRAAGSAGLGRSAAKKKYRQGRFTGGGSPAA